MRTRSPELFNVTIVTTVNGRTMDAPTVTHLKQEIESLKTALLYGDNVDLFSFAWSAWKQYLVLDDPDGADPKWKLSYFEYLLDNMTEEFPHPDMGRELLRRCINHLRGEGNDDFTPDQRRAARRVVDGLWPLFMEGYISKEFPELLSIRKLIDDGRLLLVDINGTPAKETLPVADVVSFMSEAGPGFFPKEAYDLASSGLNYFNNLCNAVMDSQLPMLDSGAAKLLKWRQAGIPTVGARRAAVPLAGNLFARLPIFRNASLDEIIDIRIELEGCIRSFQKAVVALSVQLVEVSEADFDFEAEKLYDKEVEPLLAEIDEKIRENRYMRRLATNLSSDWKTTLTGMTGVVFGATTLGALITMLGAGVATVPAMKAVTDHLITAKDIRQHKFFFLHQLATKSGDAF